MADPTRPHILDRAVGRTILEALTHAAPAIRAAGPAVAVDILDRHGVDRAEQLQVWSELGAFAAEARALCEPPDADGGTVAPAAKRPAGKRN